MRNPGKFLTASWFTRAVPALVIVGALAAMTVTPFLGANAPAAAQRPVQLELAAQTPYVTADGELAMALIWTGPRTDDLSLAVAVHGRVRNEADLDSPAGEILSRSQPASLPLKDVPVNELGQLLATVPIRSFSPANDDRIWLEEAGVYPVTVEIRGPEGLVSSLRTNLIRLPTETAELELLPVSIVLAVDSADGFTLEAATTLLSQHPTIPLSVLFGEGVMAQLFDDPTRAAAFQDALNGRPVLTQPELSLDPSALAEIGRGDLYQTALEQTRAALTSLGLEVAQDIIPIDVPLTSAGAQLIIDLGYSAVIDVGAAPQSGGFITTDDGTLEVVQIDDDLSAALAGSGRAIGRAHHLLARLAIRYETDRTPVVIGGDAIARAGIDSLDILLSAVDTLGLLVAGDLLDQASAGLPIRVVENASQDLRELSAEIDQTLTLIDTYGSFHITGGVAPEALRNDLLAALSRDLNPEGRARASDLVRVKTEAALDVLTIADTQSVTVAARSSIIPLTVNNAASGPRSVLLRFQTDKVDVVQDGQVIEVPAGISQLDIEVQTRSLGLSPLEMVVLTPDERRELTRTSFQVRSTAVPGLGMLLSGTAMVLLLAWWAKSIHSSRRSKAEQDHDPVGPTDASGISSSSDSQDDPHTDGPATTNLPAAVTDEPPASELDSSADGTTASIEATTRAKG